jgi:hypothetical protein
MIPQQQDTCRCAIAPTAIIGQMLAEVKVRAGSATTERASTSREINGGHEQSSCGRLTFDPSVLALALCFKALA